MLLLNFATVLILWFGARRAELGKISEAGDVIAVIQYVALIANAVLMLSFTIAWLPKLKVSAKRISEVLNMEKCDVGADDEFVSPFDAKEGASVELNVSYAVRESFKVGDRSRSALKITADPSQLADKLRGLTDREVRLCYLLHRRFKLGLYVSAAVFAEVSVLVGEFFKVCIKINIIKFHFLILCFLLVV